MKRRWDDDVVFKNQARGTEDKGKKEFINVSCLPVRESVWVLANMACRTSFARISIRDS
jgi:hypothetical protein